MALEKLTVGSLLTHKETLKQLKAREDACIASTGSGGGGHGGWLRYDIANVFLGVVTIGRGISIPGERHEVLKRDYMTVYHYLPVYASPRTRSEAKKTKQCSSAYYVNLVSTPIKKDELLHIAQIQVFGLTLGELEEVLAKSIETLKNFLKK